MTIVERLAAFVDRASYEDLSQRAAEELKIRIIDSLGVAIGAIGSEVMQMVRMHVEDFSRSGASTLIGGGSTSPDLAALYNSGLVRYLDYNDSYLARGETCHPSDNLGALLAAGQCAEADGKALLTALAVAYQVQCRLSDEAPVRAKGFDHTTQGAYAVAAGVSKILGLEPEKIANAIAISATPLNALRVTRTGTLSHWKGLAYPYTAFGATASTFLAMRGITGPKEVFEGNKGFQETIAGPFSIDWEREDLERVTGTIIKKYNAEIHSQATLEGVLELKEKHRFDPAAIERVDIDTFDVAYNIIGGGEEGDKTRIRTKEEADHSLQYMVAAALLDGRVSPDQYKPERIGGTDVQELLRKVIVRPEPAYSARFPESMPCRIRIRMADRQVFEMEKQDYEGFHSRAMEWKAVTRKFDSLAATYAPERVRGRIVDLVRDLERHTVDELMELLTGIGVPAA